MPLTPAEVHNVAFKKPPIGKRGYDEEEVDAFLDIVEVELARLIEENNDLRARANGGAPSGAPAGAPVDDGRLEAAQNELSAAQHELNSAREDNQRLQAHVGELERALSAGNDGAQQQVVQLQQQLAETEQQLSHSRQQLEQAQQAIAEAQAAQASQPEGGPASATTEHHQQAVQMLALAQQTADQHLAQSKAEAERLLTEAQRNHEETIGAAQQQAQQQLSEA